MPNLIYSVEDDASIRELIGYALTNAGYEVLSFDNAESMLSALEKRIPALIILDIMLPQTDGIEALKFIRAKYENVGIKILMLTAKTSEVNKITGLELGADDYITKPFSVLELTARVKAHLRKFTTSAADGALIFAGIKLNPSSRAVTTDDEATILTYKEFELLHYLIKNTGKVISREDLLRDIWGDEYFGESRTVDIHIKNLRAKLKSNANCIVSVRGVGYVLKEK